MDEKLKKMDDAAVLAEQDLVEMMKSWSTEDMIGAIKLSYWFLKWYEQAGYKRLGKLLKSIADNEKLKT